MISGCCFFFFGLTSTSSGELFCFQKSFLCVWCPLLLINLALNTSNLIFFDLFWLFFIDYDPKNKYLPSPPPPPNTFQFQLPKSPRKAPRLGRFAWFRWEIELQELHPLFSPLKCTDLDMREEVEVFRVNTNLLILKIATKIGCRYLTRLDLCSRIFTSDGKNYWQNLKLWAWNKIWIPKLRVDDENPKHDEFVK